MRFQLTSVVRCGPTNRTDRSMIWQSWNTADRICQERWDHVSNEGFALDVSKAFLSMAIRTSIN